MATLTLIPGGRDIDPLIACGEINGLVLRVTDAGEDGIADVWVRVLMGGNVDGDLGGLIGEAVTLTVPAKNLGAHDAKDTDPVPA